MNWHGMNRYGMKGWVRAVAVLGCGLASVSLAAEGDLLAKVTPPDAWVHPADRSALRGSSVTDVLRHEDVLYIATLGGGVHNWNGSDVGSVAGTAGLSVYALAAVPHRGQTEVWAATDAGLWRIGASGAAQRVQAEGWRAGDASLTDLVSHAGQAWVLTTSGEVWAVPTATTVPTAAQQVGCSALWSLPADGDALLPEATAMATCEDGVVQLAGGIPWSGSPFGAQPTHAIARAEGHWLVERAGLRAVFNGMEVDTWSPPDVSVADVRGAARLHSSLLVAAGPDGAWLLSDQPAQPLSPVDGVPGTTAYTAHPGPRGQAWLGTDAGLVLVSAVGTGLSFPVAAAAATPFQADAGDRLIAHPQDSGAMVLDRRGLRWWGTRAPRGLSALDAAAGDTAWSVLRDAEGGWWALCDEVVFRLGPRGALTRWDLHASLHHAVAAGRGVAFATDAGVRWWLPGATQLSAALPAPGDTLLTGDAAGSTWWTTPEGLAVASFASPDEAQRISLDQPLPVEQAWVQGGRALLMNDGQLITLSADGRQLPLVLSWSDATPRQGPVPALADLTRTGDGTTWVLLHDGTVAKLLAGGVLHPLVPAPGQPRWPVPTALTASKRSLWLGTDTGVWRVQP